MKNIFSSATKVVFVLLAISACVGFFMDKITNEQFVGILSMVFAFYYRGTTTNSDTENKPAL